MRPLRVSGVCAHEFRHGKQRAVMRPWSLGGPGLGHLLETGTVWFSCTVVVFAASVLCAGMSCHLQRPRGSQDSVLGD